MKQKLTVKKGNWCIKEIAKYLLIRLSQAVIRIFYVIPINKRRIVFHSYKGKQYSCNPRAVSEYLSEHYPGKYEIIWFFRNPRQFQYLKEKGIGVVPYVSLKRVILEVTAAASVNNMGSFNWIPRRKGQLHVNTWHGGGCYKKIYTDPLSGAVRRMTVKQTSHMISSSQFFSEHVVREEFQFKRKILEIGMPRNDVFFYINQMQEKNRTVRKRYGVSSEKTIILYAPTWRFDKEMLCPDFNYIREAAQKLFGKDVVLFSRVHYYLKHIIGDSIDTTDYPDMQDLLCAADILITDYSSSIWDYSFTYRPCFLYAADVDEYIENRGFDKDIYTWGFPVCKSDKELYDAIVNFDQEDFREKMEKHHRELGSFENGRAAEEFCSFLNKYTGGGRQ